MSIEDAKEYPIQEYLQSKGISIEKRGSTWFCSSPFSRDTNWSFCVYPSNTFFCWSTGKAGDVIQLVKLLEGCSFREAINYIGERNFTPYKANYKQFKEDENFWANFDHNKYINKNEEEKKAIISYGQSRSIVAGFMPGVYFTRDHTKGIWLRNPSLMFVHVDKNLKVCGAKFRNVYDPIILDGHNGSRFSSRGRLGFYILSTEVPETYEKSKVWLCESETSSNSLWSFFKDIGKPATIISMGGVSSAPKELPLLYQGREVRLIIDYDGDEKLYNERLTKYGHLANTTPIKLILPKGEDINSLYHKGEMWRIENLLI